MEVNATNATMNETEDRNETILDNGAALENVS